MIHRSCYYVPLRSRIRGKNRAHLSSWPCLVNLAPNDAKQKPCFFLSLLFCIFMGRWRWQEEVVISSAHKIAIIVIGSRYGWLRNVYGMILRYSIGGGKMGPSVYKFGDPQDENTVCRIDNDQSNQRSTHTPFNTCTLKTGSRNVMITLKRKRRENPSWGQKMRQ